MIVLILLSFLVVLGINNAEQTDSPSIWQYKCKAGQCEKSEIGPNDSVPQSLAICQLFCGSSGALWPMPTGHVSMGNHVVSLNKDDIMMSGVDVNTKAGQLLKTNVDRLKSSWEGAKSVPGGPALAIHFKIIEQIPDELQLTLDTNENYTLNIHLQDSKILNATIVAHTYFGARHGFETLTQLIVRDSEYSDDIKIVQDVHIQDSPVYPYRGILLDTSRNYVDLDTIMRTIRAMGMSKLNTLHWHISDTHSFPYVSKTWPLLSKYGAYSSRKVYSSEHFDKIREFGLLNGVRILPELDAPAHVGEGWQWVGDNATVCFKAEPWRSYCVEPPCGQINPTSDKVYEILEGIYSDMIDDFKPDIFHMGGDEVNLGCWKSVGKIKDWMLKQGWNVSNADYYKLWDYFQTKAYKKLTKANNNKEMDAILWSSEMTNEENLKYLDPKKYIIQVWKKVDDDITKRLLNKKFRIIFSNQDSLYLDCGYSAWIGEGNNWCSPYKGWQKIYQLSPKYAIQNLNLTDTSDLILGMEATLWSEQVEGPAVDTKLWPRAAALAERGWAEPDISWHHAENRFLWHRERLAKSGIITDAQKPEWCIQNQGFCY